MAIRSTFYDTQPGEGVTEVPWAQSAISRGPTYGVVGPDALKLTAHPTTPYAVNIGPGKFFGHGVWDDNESTALVQCATPAAGSTRWDLIAGRRDWQPAGGGPTSLRAISGTATMAIPAGRENRPGIVDDQPVWLVQWKAGLPQPQQIIDLRVWAGPGGVEAAHKLALSYLAEPGAAVKVGSTIWRYERQDNNVWDWFEDQRLVFTAANTTLDAPHIRAGTVTIASDGNGAAAITFPSPMPRRLLGAQITQSVASNLGLIHFMYDEGLSNRTRAAFFVYDRLGNRLRNTSGIRISYMAWGE